MQRNVLDFVCSTSSARNQLISLPSGECNSVFQGCQFCSVSSGMVEIFHTNSKNGIK